MHNNVESPNEVVKQLGHIFYDNKSHPLGLIRQCLFLFMNRHDQESYTQIRTQKKELASSEIKEETSGSTDVESEVFLDGPAGTYNNILMKDYLDHLEKIEGFFDRLKQKCSLDPKLPQSEAAFIQYAKNISDYSIGRDYARGGAGRRIYDQLKTDCLEWCEKRYQELYENDELDENRKLAITLCHLLIKINMLAKQNNQIVKLLEDKQTFQENAGTPRSSIIFSSKDLAAARNSRTIVVSDKENNEQADSKLDEARQNIDLFLRPLINDFLCREEIYLHKYQNNLPHIAKNDNELSPSFWKGDEDIESYLKKVIYQLTKFLKNTDLNEETKKPIRLLIDQITDHISFYKDNRKKFTDIYKKLVPDDFYTSDELACTLKILSIIRDRANRLKTDNKNNYDNQQNIDIESFIKQINLHLLFLQKDVPEFTGYCQYAKDSYLLLPKFIGQLIKLNKQGNMKELMIELINQCSLYKITKFAIMSYLIKPCTERIPYIDLKEIIYKFCANSIPKEEFEYRFKKQLVEDLYSADLSELLIKICILRVNSTELDNDSIKQIIMRFSSALSIAAEETNERMEKIVAAEQVNENLKSWCISLIIKTFEHRLQNFRQNNIEESVCIEELKEIGLEFFPEEILGQLLITHFIEPKPNDYLSNQLIKLGEELLKRPPLVLLNKTKTGNDSQRSRTASPIIDRNSSSPGIRSSNPNILFTNSDTKINSLRLSKSGAATPPLSPKGAATPPLSPKGGAATPPLSPKGGTATPPLSPKGGQDNKELRASQTGASISGWLGRLSGLWSSKKSSDGKLDTKSELNSDLNADGKRRSISAENAAVITPKAEYALATMELKSPAGSVKMELQSPAGSVKSEKELKRRSATATYSSTIRKP